MSIHRLDDIILQRVLHYADEGSVCALAGTARPYRPLTSDDALWKALALLRDPRLKRESLTWLEPKGRGGGGRGRRSIWRGACRRLNTKLSPSSWPERLDVEVGSPSSAAPQMRARLDDVFNADGLGPNLQLPEHIRSASDVGVGGLWGGQSPHLFRIGEGRLLSVGGGFYAEGVGGAEVHPLHDVALLDLTNSPSAPRFDTLIQGVRPEGQAENCHPLLHGSASDWDAEGNRALFFGGGAPHTHLTDETSALQLTAAEAGGGCPQANWCRLPVHGNRPSPRQGCRGVVFENSFYIFGGRERGGDCLNDVWCLDLERPGERLNAGRSYCWRELFCEGQAPSPRVWPACCHAHYGKWFVIGGSEWQFEVNEDVETDYQTLYILDIRERQWSSLALADPPKQPSWLVSSCLVPIGHREVLYLGGTLPQLIGRQGLDMRALKRWREFYARLDRPWVLDLKSSSWRQEKALLGDVGKCDVAIQRSNVDDRASEVLFRSHAAAVYMPERGSVLVFGGSRYFTGEYFHDLIELKLPSHVDDEDTGGASAASSSPAHCTNPTPVATLATSKIGEGEIGEARGSDQEGRGSLAHTDHEVASGDPRMELESKSRNQVQDDNENLEEGGQSDHMDVDEEGSHNFRSIGSSNGSFFSSEGDDDDLPEFAQSDLENEAPPFMATRNSRFRAGNQSLLTRGFRGRMRAMARAGLLPIPEYRHVLTL